MCCRATLGHCKVSATNTFYQSPSIVPQKNWFDTFEDLTNAINKVPKNQTVVLFFDEFPWMATPRSRILVALELYWNRYWVFNKRIKLVVCGSSTSWIINNIINNKGGLHNRVTRTINLQPFSLYETEGYLKEHQIKLNRKQILDLYTVLGGVPLYWSFIRKGQSAHQCIDELCFQKNGPLVNEFKRLFESLFEDPKPYIELIRFIADHRYGIGQAQLIALSKLPNGGSTIDRLHQLEEAGFVTSLVPYGHKDRGVYYVMDDEYSLFYLRWIEPHLKTIAKKETNEGFWLFLSSQSSWKVWSGYAFESICYKHINQIRRALHIDPGARVGTSEFIRKNNIQAPVLQSEAYKGYTGHSMSPEQFENATRGIRSFENLALDNIKKIPNYVKGAKFAFGFAGAQFVVFTALKVFNDLKKY